MQVSRVTKVVKGGKSMSFRCVPVPVHEPLPSRPYLASTQLVSLSCAAALQAAGMQQQPHAGLGTWRRDCGAHLTL